MNTIHSFEATLSWKKKDLEAESSKRYFLKSHSVQLAGKPDIAVSAAKIFKGDPTLYNPEDLLLTSLVSCHMMSYLYVCAQHQIDILSYSDKAEALLETYDDGSGKIIEVRLHPIVHIPYKSQEQKAIALHAEANKLCFIANSCNFPVLHSATCIGLQ